MSEIIIMITIAVYLIGMLFIGFACSKKNKNTDDFYLGGRKLGPLVTAMSAEASDMSSYLLMGVPGLALFTGLAEASWTAIGLAVGTYLNWLFVAKRLRVHSQKLGAITVPDYFSKHFGDKKNIISAIAALVIIIFFVPYTASGFAACGKLFSELFNVDYMTAMLISAAVIVFYCVMGGFLAASTTDLIQSIVMTVALFVVVGFGVNQAGGFEAVMDNAQKLPGYLNLFKGYDAATGSAGSYGGLKVVSTLAWGLGYFGMPHILLRFMAIEDENKLKTSRRIASIWVVISLATAVLIGVVGYGMVQSGAIKAFASESEAETVIIKISNLLSSFGWFPSIMAGIILAGILAATMSTADSQLIAASSSVSSDLLRNTFKVKVSDKFAMWIARGTVVAISIIAVILASDESSSVFKVVSFAWAGFGAAFGPVMLASLFWKRANKYGAIAGMVVGGAMVFIWKYVIAPLGGIFGIYELLPAFICACIAIVVVSLLTPPRENDLVQE